MSCIERYEIGLLCIVVILILNPLPKTRSSKHCSYTKKEGKNEQTRINFEFGKAFQICIHIEHLINEIVCNDNNDDNLTGGKWVEKAKLSSTFCFSFCQFFRITSKFDIFSVVIFTRSFGRPSF